MLAEDTFIFGGEGDDKVEIFNGIARTSTKDIYIDLGDGKIVFTTDVSIYNA